MYWFHNKQADCFLKARETGCGTKSRRIRKEGGCGEGGGRNCDRERKGQGRTCRCEGRGGVSEGGRGTSEGRRGPSEGRRGLSEGRKGTSEGRTCRCKGRGGVSEGGRRMSEADAAGSRVGKYEGNDGTDAKEHVTGEYLGLSMSSACKTQCLHAVFFSSIISLLGLLAYCLVLSIYLDSYY